MCIPSGDAWNCICWSSDIQERVYLILLSVLKYFELWSCRVQNSLQLSTRLLPRELLLKGGGAWGRVNKGQRVAPPFVALCCDHRTLLTIFNGVFVFLSQSEYKVWIYRYHEMSIGFRLINHLHHVSACIWETFQSVMEPNTNVSACIWETFQSVMELNTQLYSSNLFSTICT